MDMFDLLVVPSKWQETFGFVALEALSYAVPVLVSEHVGAKNLLEQYPGIGFIYDGTKLMLQECLERIYLNRNLLEEGNNAILSCDIRFDFKQHVKKILDFYSVK